MTTPIVQVRHLTKRFGDFVAVNDISFDIQPGEILGLLGPNGAGKTTTIQMMLGLITPTGGTIRMFALDLATHREVIMQQVNFSSTYISMPYSLTVEENLRVIARLYGMRHVDQRLDEVMKQLEMEEMRHKLTRKLSSGQMTRLTLAKAILTEPKVLFLDEPTASLDPDIAHKIRALLQDVRRSTGLSMLYTSHNMREMEELCDRLVFLHQGKILFEGTPKQVLADRGKEDLEALFIDVARNVVEEEHA